MKIPKIDRGESARIEVGDIEELLEVPIISRFTTLAMLAGGDKSRMVVAAISDDDQVLGLMPVMSMDDAKNIAEGVMRGAFAVYGPDEPEDEEDSR